MDKQINNQLYKTSSYLSDLKRNTFYQYTLIKQYTYNHYFLQFGNVYFFDFLIIRDTKVLTINKPPIMLRKLISCPRNISNKQLNRTYVCPINDTSVKLPFIYALFINIYVKYDVSPIMIKISISFQSGIISCLGCINNVAAGAIRDMKEKYYKMII
ncbi:hypothetical protein pb186bvf_018645 [Paramecium bursaria]